MAQSDSGRRIKKLVQQAFPGHKVSVRWARHGWLYVKVGYQPRDWNEQRELERLTESLILKSDAGNDVGTYGYDDPGSDYGYGRNMRVTVGE